MNSSSFFNTIDRNIILQLKKNIIRTTGFLSFLSLNCQFPSFSRIAGYLATSPHILIIRQSSLLKVFSKVFFYKQHAGININNKTLINITKININFCKSHTAVLKTH